MSQQKTPWNLTILLWTNRLEELEEVLTAQYYCYDQIHSVGLMNAEPNSTAEELDKNLLASFCICHEKLLNGFMTTKH